MIQYSRVPNPNIAEKKQDVLKINPHIFCGSAIFISPILIRKRTISIPCSIDTGNNVGIADPDHEYL